MNPRSVAVKQSLILVGLFDVREHTGLSDFKVFIA